jgi:hypothetical protein
LLAAIKEDKNTSMVENEQPDLFLSGTKNRFFYISTGIILFAFFFWIYQYMWYEHDDYGYATLKYATEAEFRAGQNFLSTDFSLIDLLSFLKNHYTEWGGRVVPFFFLCLILKFPPVVFAVLQTLLTVGCLLYVNKNESAERSLAFNILIAVVLLAMPVPLFRDGVMWMTASILYYWGSLLMVITLYTLVRYPQKAIAYVLVFLVSIWHENIGLAMAGIVFLLVVFHFQFSIWKRLLLMASSFVGVALLIFAPGNFSRMNHECCKDFYAIGFVERIIMRLREVFTYYVDIPADTFPMFLFVGLGVLVVLSMLYIQEKKKYLLWSLWGYIGIVLLMIAFSKRLIVLPQIVLGLFFIIYLASSCLVILYDYVKNKKALHVVFFAAFWILFLSGILSPYGGARTFVPGYILALFFLYTTLNIAFSFYSLKPFILYLTILLVMGGLSTSILYKVEGYKQNYAIHQRNHQKLQEAALQGKTTVRLETPQDEFVNAPIRHTIYQIHWMKPFYNLPAATQIEFVGGEQSNMGEER